MTSPRQTEWQRLKQHGKLLPMATADRRIFMTHRICVEQDQSFLDEDQAQQEIRSPWRSAGVAVSMLLAIVLFITLAGVLQ